VGPFRTREAASERIAKEGKTLAILFTILEVLNFIVCILALTVNLLYYRKPEKKDSAEEVRKERVRFREHWMIMIWWVLGTIVIPAFELNILWMIPWIIIGASSAAFLSGSHSTSYRSPVDTTSSDKQTNKSRAPQRSKASKASPKSTKAGDMTKNEVTPDQSTRLPDLGKHLALNGTPQKQMMIYPSFTITEIAVVCLGGYCVTKIGSARESVRSDVLRAF
jgi:uncharacterized membrane protein